MSSTQALQELKDFMIIKGIATKERQKLMRNLRVIDLLVRLLQTPLQGAIDLTHLTRVFKGAYDVLYTYMIGNSRKNALYFAKYIDFFQTQITVKVVRPKSPYICGFLCTQAWWLGCFLNFHLTGRHWFECGSDDCWTDKRQQENCGSHHPGSNWDVREPLETKQGESLSALLVPPKIIRDNPWMPHLWFAELPLFGLVECSVRVWWGGHSWQPDLHHRTLAAERHGRLLLAPTNPAWMNELCSVFQSGMRFLTERGQNVNGQPNIIYVSMDNGTTWSPLHEFVDVRDICWFPSQSYFIHLTYCPLHFYFSERTTWHTQRKMSSSLSINWTSLGKSHM